MTVGVNSLAKLRMSVLSQIGSPVGRFYIRRCASASSDNRRYERLGSCFELAEAKSGSAALSRRLTKNLTVGNLHSELQNGLVGRICPTQPQFL